MLWVTRAAIKWLFLATMLQAACGGFISDSIPLILAGREQKEYIPTLLAVHMLGFLIGMLCYTFASMKWKLPHKKACFVCITLSALIIPFYATPSIKEMAIAIVFSKFIEGAQFVALSTMFRCFLPNNPNDHIGFAFMRTALWTITWSAMRIVGYRYVQSGLPLVIWSFIGGMLILLSIVPLIIASRVQKLEPIQDKEENLDCKSSTESLPKNPLIIGLTVLSSSAMVHGLKTGNQNYVPLYLDSQVWAGAVMTGGNLGYILGGILAFLLPARWAASTLKATSVVLTIVAAVFYLTNNEVVMFIGLLVTAISVSLNMEIVGQRMFANLKNKTLATAVPYLSDHLLMVLVVWGYGTIGINYGYDVMYLCMVPLGLLSLAAFKWLKPFLENPNK
jgi:hypothetical protein